jgi:hypothetical protein
VPASSAIRGISKKMGSVTMEEMVPLLLGAVFGAVIWRKTSGRVRIGASIAAVIASAIAATLVSGEFRESWLFLLFDAGLAVFGLAVGFFLSHAYPRLAGKSGLNDLPQRTESSIISSQPLPSLEDVYLWSTVGAGLLAWLVAGALVAF